MNKNLYNGTYKLPHKTLRVHSSSWNHLSSRSQLIYIIYILLGLFAGTERLSTSKIPSSSLSPHQECCTCTGRGCAARLLLRLWSAGCVRLHSSGVSCLPSLLSGASNRTAVKLSSRQHIIMQDVSLYIFPQEHLLKKSNLCSVDVNSQKGWLVFLFSFSLMSCQPHWVTSGSKLKNYNFAYKMCWSNPLVVLKMGQGHRDQSE